MRKVLQARGVGSRGNAPRCTGSILSTYGNRSRGKVIGSRYRTQVITGVNLLYCPKASGSNLGQCPLQKRKSLSFHDRTRELELS